MISKFHPTVPGLKCSEDGSLITLDQRPLAVLTYKSKRQQTKETVCIKGKNVYVTRLVCECFNGLAPTPEHQAVLIDKTKPVHYTNIEWQLKKIEKPEGKLRYKLTMDEFNEINLEAKKTSLSDVLRKRNIALTAYYQFKKRHKK